MSKAMQFVRIMEQAREANSSEERENVIKAFKLWKSQNNIKGDHPSIDRFYSTLVADCELDELLAMATKNPKPVGPKNEEIKGRTFLQFLCDYFRGKHD